jgi:hypothetical protein
MAAVRSRIHYPHGFGDTEKFGHDNDLQTAILALDAEGERNYHYSYSYLILLGVDEQSPKLHTGCLHFHSLFPSASFE